MMAELTFQVSGVDGKLYGINQTSGFQEDALSDRGGDGTLAGTARAVRAARAATAREATIGALARSRDIRSTASLKKSRTSSPRCYLARHR